MTETMNINGKTWYSEQPENHAKKDHPYELNKIYLIRTVTMIQTGILYAVYDNELVLSNASWIADTGRFQDALESGNFDEVELFPQDKKVIIGRNAIIDCVEIDIKLPEEQK